ncbi:MULTISPECIES: ChbG/HpnK family deacetylase [unclassified Azospirillum]|uniref:ChbG/HpnK family deacetylase n=1 Tax=unclassified Azospirillum TaxID=2630922 RepID=UPI000B6809D3|nr:MULTISPECIES: ChbG/HpnK family deacetylase [unclassified Azospirillum]SNS31082.1 hypothetical protein SAMN05880556_103423 [Azospirillum sp. RU38E]SNS49478.1 hypothetical protein SAMN05880591_103423 [Azospirillum sp. RU37A]
MSQIPVTLIADDYALAPGISEAVLELAAAGRLSGTGAMVPSPLWPDHARRLATAPAGFQAGLHLTLTGGLSPLGDLGALAPGGQLPGIDRWMGWSLSGRLRDPAPRRLIAAEIARQLDRFEDALGRAPDFIDGHQHVHLLPGIRGPLLDEMARRYPAGRVWLRNCAAGPGAILARGVAPAKAGLIAALALGLAAAAQRRGIPTNRGFAGVYGFDGDFPARMRRFLTRARPGLLVMVHPGYPDEILAALDPLTEPRLAELHYLASPAFADDLARADLVVARGQTIPLG